jgi:hypothetical protein
MRRPTTQGAAQRTHSNEFRHYEAATDRFGRSAEHHCCSQQRTIARTTRKSDEYRRIRGRTYCLVSLSRASIWGIPTKMPEWAILPPTIAGNPRNVP